MTIAYLKNGANASANVDGSSTAQRFVFVPSDDQIAYINKITIGILDDAAFEAEYGSSDMAIVAGSAPKFGVETVGEYWAWDPIYEPIDVGDDLTLHNAFMLAAASQSYDIFTHDTGSSVNRCQVARINFDFPFAVSRKGSDDQQFTCYLSGDYSLLIEHVIIIEYQEVTDFIPPKFLIGSRGL